VYGLDTPLLLDIYENLSSRELLPKPIELKPKGNVSPFEVTPSTISTASIAILIISIKTPKFNFYKRFTSKDISIAR